MAVAACSCRRIASDTSDVARCEDVDTSADADGSADDVAVVLVVDLAAAPRVIGANDGAACNESGNTASAAVAVAGILDRSHTNAARCGSDCDANSSSRTSRSIRRVVDAERDVGGASRGSAVGSGVVTFHSRTRDM